MPVARIDLTAAGEDEPRRKREQRRRVSTLAVMAGIALLAFAGREPEPALRLDSAATDFGAQPVGSRATKTVSLRNTTGEPFVVTGIVAEGAVTRQDFEVDLSPCATIAPGAECAASVSFAPRDAGERTAKFRVIDGSNETSQTIVVRGAGVVPVVAPVVTPPPPPPDPVVAPEPVPVTPPAVRPKPPAPKPPVKEKEVEVPAPTIEEPEVVDAPLPETPAPAPAETPAPPKESRGKSFWKKVGAVAIPVIVGAVIANNTNHGHHAQQGDRRLDVSPRALTEGGVVTVTNAGSAAVTIRAVGFADDSRMFMQSSDCQGRSLAPREACRITVRSTQGASGAQTTLVVDSDIGRASVSVSAPGVPPRVNP